MINVELWLLWKCKQDKLYTSIVMCDFTDREQKKWDSVILMKMFSVLLKSYFILRPKQKCDL